MTERLIHDPLTIRRLYGRQQGHTLRTKQAELVENTLPTLEVASTGPVLATDLFGDDRPLEFEIGFGKGEHLAGQARMRPHHGFIGCEPFLDGVVGLLTTIENDHLKNIRLHRGDALDVLERLPDNCLDRAYLLHPDPWPKARHAKRRFMNHGPIGLIAQKMKKGGEFRFGTDHPIYCRWAMMIMGQRPDFEWLATTPQDFLKRPEDWPQTRYEKKARQNGHEVWYFRYRRR
ncbi:MAG: tRNA (guanine(46)-N(7))-methyltransferase TrmB [Zymomonas mobilis subsp. pomaceae]|uniref:tRNA (guanine-N(7)-)-methyltransferase n=1 Tax=Zymomonas mobilis subsp. pomaceae (strain ATCC 29192 / DSM 22645 / JCM 10191 / CCUG 17912 / NBRC 13757 / NCIMB 11200 / NRRL B-4491 / Barker I) TaxID=579138 RepID=F8ETC4_ZYMMT|nr:tRNA (guanine(46)-N(7))-methyltransferase TrmB [Zymomonas mobilis]AEI37949.1 tRNA (guanine-N(7)-)-methyltransferase [Zymomonas mobilis subsp. pomaceae ATCC 29192]MDX5949317.1 tRNA (guanine(46)-N(7))-methyltransferase TrmB [Zymomonas mobilis subsp. pomaceae]GEB89676.1 tRNA (guanine-N(7)-)-methyltransferase [Zymomonas mobilis subsp. pomaceae]